MKLYIYIHVYILYIKMVLLKTINYSFMDSSTSLN